MSSKQDYKSIDRAKPSSPAGRSASSKDNVKTRRMGCCGNSSEDGGTPVKFDPNFNGPIKKRGCTDILCLLLFILYWIGMVLVAIFGFRNGDPERLIRPIDSMGQFCGRTDAVANRPFLLFFDVTRCATTALTLNPDQLFTCNTPQVCVKECPDANDIGILPGARTRNNTYCTDGRTVAVHLEDPIQMAKDILYGVCPPYYLRSENVLGRCVPVLADFEALLNATITTADGADLKTATGSNFTGTFVTDGIKELAKFLNLRSFAEAVWTDMGRIWPWVLGGFVVILVVCFLYIFLIRFVIKPMIYLSMLLILGVTVWGIYICYSEYTKLKNDPKTDSASSLLDTFRYQEETWLGLGIALTIIAVIILLIFLFLRKRINLAVEVIKESSKAVGSIKSAVFFPIITYFMQFALFAWFVGVGVFLVTASDPIHAYDNLNDLTTANYTVEINGTMTELSYTQGVSCNPSDEGAMRLVEFNLTNSTICAFKQFSTDSTLFRIQLYHFFGWLWGLNWILALGQCVLAGAFASYYWAFEKPKDMPYFPVAGSLKRTLVYHTGSLAFGALIIAIVQFIRAVLAYLDAKLGRSENKVAKFVVKCLACFFWCLEKILKFINKNAYILIAIYGYNFCTAARKAFNLILRNIVRVVVLNKITAFILFLGKLLITGIVGVIAFYVFDSIRERDGLNYYLVPIIFLCIVAFVTAHGFLNVFDMAIDTIFLCVLEDLERNDGSPSKPYYMSSGLKKVLSVKNDATDQGEASDKN